MVIKAISIDNRGLENRRHETQCFYPFRERQATTKYSNFIEEV